MSELIQANWILFVAALLIGIAVAYWIFVANRKTRVVTTKPDVLDEGAEPARRNQALIDAPTAALKAEPAPAAEPVSAPVPEPVATEPAAPVVQPEPAPAPAPEPVTAPAGADDLKRIKGLGPKLAKLLNDLGITSFAQIAAWTEADIDRIDAQLGTFAGRIRRDSWVDQAKLLAAGDTTGFQGKFGNL